MTRTPLCERSLPDYSRGMELANMISHILGAALGLGLLGLCLFLSIRQRDPWAIVSSSIYSLSVIGLFSVSSVYHGLRPGYAKKVMQVIDHCTIYFLIVGTYTPILLTAVRPLYPALAWLILGAELLFAAFAATFTAIDHKRYGKISMIGYIGMGWMIVLALEPTLEAVGREGFWLLLLGGIAYTLGAVLYGCGKKKPLLHTVFHLFVVLGCALQALCILFYVL